MGRFDTSDLGVVIVRRSLAHRDELLFHEGKQIRCHPPTKISRALVGPGTGDNGPDVRSDIQFTDDWTIQPGAWNTVESLPIAQALKLIPN